MFPWWYGQDCRLSMHFSFRRFKKKNDNALDRKDKVCEFLRDRSIVLVGLMGAGKTAVGKRLAVKLDIPFVDADNEIESAAGKSISDIFEEDGETFFRDGEKRVIKRLLKAGSAQVLATGGGAYMNAETRQSIEEHAVSVWLHADLHVLMERVGRRSHRPLLANDNPQAVMEKLIQERYPVYGKADIVVKSRDVPHEVIVDEIIIALYKYLNKEAKK